MEVARHALVRETEVEEICIRAQDPVNPLWRRPAAWVAAAGVAILLGLGCAEASLALQMRASQAQLDALNASGSAPAPGPLLSSTAESKRLRTLLAEQQKELNQLQMVHQVAERELPRCTNLLPNLLDALAEAVSEELVLERVEHADGNAVTVVAWSLTQLAAQRLGHQLALDERLWCLELAENNVRSAKGRLGLDGYLVELRFVGSSGPESSLVALQEQRTGSVP
jgi:hypothetical protein